MAYLSGWYKRQQVTIPQESGSGTNYTCVWEVHSGSGSNGAGVVYLNDATNFPNCVRFTAVNGTTLLDHFLEKVDYGAVNDDDIVATFRIEVTEDIGADDVDIYIYYGKDGVASVSSCADAFLVGQDFDGGASTGLTTGTAGGGTLTVPNPTQIFDILRTEHGSRISDWPVVARSGWCANGVRDLGILLDANNRMVVESGNIIAYCYGKSAASARTLGRFTSSTKGRTWTSYGSNPILSASGTSGRFDEDAAMSAAAFYLPGVGPDTDKPYKFIYGGYVAGLTNNLMGLAESTDGLSLTRYDGANADKSVTGLHYSDYWDDDLSQAMTHVGIPWGIKVGNKILLVFEGHSSGGKWYVLGALSGESDSQPDLTTWTPLNQNGSGKGCSLLPHGAAGKWDDYGVANPKIIDVSPIVGGSNKFIMSYNGCADSNSYWNIGFAYTSTAPASWDGTNFTKVNIDIPAIPRDLGDANQVMCECSAMTIDDLEIGASRFRFWYQGFAAGGNTPQIGMFLIPQGRVLFGKSATAATDGWSAGVDLDGITTCMIEALWNGSDQYASDVSGTSYFMFGNSATVPTPFAYDWDKFRFGFFLYNNNTTTYMHEIAIFRQTTGGSVEYWTGSGWGAITRFGVTTQHIIKLMIWDDGTNFKADAVDLASGVSIITGSPSTAKASVKSFSAGRIFLCGDFLSNYYYSAGIYDNIIIRNYHSPEPAIGTAGAEETRNTPRLLAPNNTLLVSENTLLVF